jgi:hypothetical protein
MTSLIFYLLLNIILVPIATNAAIHPFLDGILGEEQNYDDLFSMIRRNQSLEIHSLSPSYLHLLNNTMESFLKNFTAMANTLEMDRDGHWEQDEQNGQDIHSDVTVDTAIGSSGISQYNHSKGEIDKVVNAVRGSHEKAQALALDAIEAFRLFKNKHNQYAVKVEESIQREIVDTVDDENADRALEEEGRLQYGATNSAKIQPKLLESQTWTNAGFMALDLPSISSDVARRVIQSITLESFRLRDDTKKDIVILSDAHRLEARTRKHFGVLDWASDVGHLIDPSLFSDTANIDSNTIFYLNLAALPSIATMIKKMELQKAGLEKNLNGPTSPASMIETLQIKVNSSETFETMSDLAFRTVALETEVLVKRIVKMAAEVKQRLKMDLVNYKSERKIQGMKEDFHSHKRIARKRSILKQSTVYEMNELNAVFSSMTQVMETTSKLLARANSTAR